ncbi:hypothetical protein [Bordetella genomosp. 7]|nr:hypothetical protein [Bordetella genomosp. 7]
MIGKMFGALSGWKAYAAAAAAGAALIAAMVGAWHWRWSSGHDAGYAAAQAEAQALNAAIERGLQAEKDRADAEYRGAVLARQAADRLVADQRKRIDGLLDQLRRRPQVARAGSRPDEPGEDWIGIFGQCVAEYERMGAEAGRLADKVNGLQGYIRAIRAEP